MVKRISKDTLLDILKSPNGLTQLLFFFQVDAHWNTFISSFTLDYEKNNLDEISTTHYCLKSPNFKGYNKEQGTWMSMTKIDELFLAIKDYNHEQLKHTGKSFRIHILNIIKELNLSKDEKRDCVAKFKHDFESLDKFPTKKVKTYILNKRLHNISFIKNILLKVNAKINPTRMQRYLVDLHLSHSELSKLFESDNFTSELFSISKTKKVKNYFDWLLFEQKLPLNQIISEIFDTKTAFQNNTIVIDTIHPIEVSLLGMKFSLGTHFSFSDNALRNMLIPYFSQSMRDNTPYSAELLIQSIYDNFFLTDPPKTLSEHTLSTHEIVALTNLVQTFDKASFKQFFLVREFPTLTILPETNVLFFKSSNYKIEFFVENINLDQLWTEGKNLPDECFLFFDLKIDQLFTTIQNKLSGNEAEDLLNSLTTTSFRTFCLEQNFKYKSTSTIDSFLTDYVLLLENLLKLSKNTPALIKLLKKDSFSLMKLPLMELDDINQIFRQNFYSKQNNVYLKQRVDAYTYEFLLFNSTNQKYFLKQILDVYTRIDEISSFVLGISSHFKSQNQENLSEDEWKDYLELCFKDFKKFIFLNQFWSVPYDYKVVSNNFLLEQVENKNGEIITETFGDNALEFLKFSKKQRKIHFFCGPTNSGKTYSGFNEIVKFKNGIYLSPLRLLAVEGQEEITARGMDCNLITGEEKEIIEGARFSSCTIETFDKTKKFEAAIIDEVQMLINPDRGWAWINALLHLDTEHLFLIGSKSSIKILEYLFSLTGETMEVTEFSRKNKLEFSGTADFSHFPKQSAIVTFSRGEAIFLRNQLIKNGFNPAIIYGALPPEVRRKQANDFKTSACDVLVATDAIGMGLNLPIQNLIFHRIDKFDGSETRQLFVEEIKQIAGRAGRFSYSNESGKIFYFSDSSDDILDKETHQLIIDAISFNGLTPFTTFFIRPNLNDILKVSEIIKSSSIASCFYYIQKYISFSDKFSIFYPKELDEVFIELDRRKNLSLEMKFKLSNISFDLESPIVLSFYKKGIDAISGNDQEAFFNQVQPLVEPTVFGIFFDEELRDLETYCSICSVYLWFARLFPEIFLHHHTISEYRTIACLIMTKTLETK